MLSGFDEPTIGLVLCEGVETGIAIFSGWTPTDLGMWQRGHYSRQVPDTGRD
jgi:hypothetical protein